MDLDKTRTDPEGQLFDQIDKVHAGMLGIKGAADLHLQPMAPELDRATKTIWFFTKKSVELVKSLPADALGVFVVVGEDHDYHASVIGRLEERFDAEVRDRFWSRVVEAWYDGGKQDPDLTMLALRLSDARVWASTDSKLKFGWEIARANMSDDDPHVGVTRNIDFAARAA